MRNMRKCIYPKDVQCITGKSEGACRKLLQRIRKRFNKRPRQLVSFKEFCDYTGLSENDLKDHLQN